MNEEQDLPGCLESVAWSDDIHVYDSMSTDDTVAIAERYGAKVTQCDYGNNKLPFGGDESKHRNWALQHIDFKNEWIYHADADERVTLDLYEAMKDAVENRKDCVAFRVRRRDYFLGRWLKHVTPSPFNIRLFMRSRLKYERAINPLVVVDGIVGNIDAHFDHFSFSKGMAHWLEKHNKYSTLEAQQIIDNHNNGVEWSFVKAFTESDRNKRRYHQKELFYRLPFRPLIKFLLLYIAKRGFLDGRAGFTYAVLQSIYEYFIILKTRELKLQDNK
jgi:glycosyltransferase involved in cell wall biosynthesis